MKTLKYVVVVSTMVVCAIVAGCASKHTVILVPDPDGHVGKASIMTEAG